MKRVPNEQEILSMAPAYPGWWTVWRDGAGPEAREPVACWALVEFKFPEGTVRSVLPMVADGMGAGLSLATEAEYAGLIYFPPGGKPVKEFTSAPPLWPGVKV